MVAHSPCNFPCGRGTLGRAGFFPAADWAGPALASLSCASAGNLYLLPSVIIGFPMHKGTPDINECIFSFVRLRAFILLFVCVCVCASFKEGIS